MSRTPVSVDTRKLLIDRVAASRYLSKSARLRALLLYLCEQVIDYGTNEIHEQQVGHAVFGRPADYDTISDNIARVHASMLRKRLEQYFSSEGRDEPVIIGLPKGNYAPIFSQRRPDQVVPELEHVTAPLFAVPSPRPRPPALLWSLAALAAVFAAFSLFLMLRGSGTLVSPPLGAKAATHGLWSEIFASGTRTDIVVDDEGVALYQDLTGTPIALSDYFNRNYLGNLNAKSSKQDVSREALASIVLKRQSSFASAALLWKLGAMASLAQAPATVHFARDYSFRELQANNAILLGTTKSNPWIEAFQDRLGLRWRYNAGRGAYYPVDTWMETSRSEDAFRNAADGYATVAVVPNLSKTGTVLILSFSGGSSLNAAGDFLADKESVARLEAGLPHAQRGKLQYFEALLCVKGRSRLTRDISIVICRPPRG